MDTASDAPSHPNPPTPKVLAQVVIRATNYARDFPNDSGCLRPSIFLHLPVKDDGKIISLGSLEGFSIVVGDDGFVRIWNGSEEPDGTKPPDMNVLPSSTYRPFSTSSVIQDGWPTRKSILDFKVESSHRVHVGVRMSNHPAWFWQMVCSAGAFAFFDQEDDNNSQVVRFASLGREHCIRPNMMSSYPRWQDLNYDDHGDHDYCRFCFSRRRETKLHKRQLSHMRQPDWICVKCLPLPPVAPTAPTAPTAPAAPAATPPPRALKKRKCDAP